MRRGLVIKIIAREPVIKSLEERLKPINLAFLDPAREDGTTAGMESAARASGAVESKPNPAQAEDPSQTIFKVPLLGRA